MPKSVASRVYERDEQSGFVAALARRPFDTFAAALAAACVGMILVNALALQEGRSPAAVPERARPAAAAPAAAPRAEAPKRSDLVEQVQTALAERDLYDGVVDGLMGQGTATAIRAFEQGQGMAVTGEASEKVLAALMIAPIRPQRGADAKPAAPAARDATQGAGQTPATTGTATTAANPKLMATQKALARIGYGPVTIDGRMGAETRNAIKAFERDRGMPETGEPSPQVLRALQALTGTPL